MASSDKPLPPWPLHEIAQFRDAVFPYASLFFLAGINLLVLLPIRESMRRREPTRASILFLSAMASIYAHILLSEPGYAWWFPGEEGEVLRAARVGQSQMWMKASSAAVVLYYVTVGEGGVWLRRLIRDKTNAPPRRPLTNLLQLFIITLAASDYVSKSEDYAVLRVGLRVMAYTAWWMLTYFTLWRGWNGELGTEEKKEEGVEKKEGEGEGDGEEGEGEGEGETSEGRPKSASTPSKRRKPKKKDNW